MAAVKRHKAPGRESQERFSDLRDSIQEHAGNVADSIADGVGQVWEDVRGLGEGLRHDAANGLDAAGVEAAERYAQGREQLDSLAAGFVQQIRQRPLAALLIAAGAGLAVGAWLRRR